MSHLRKLLVFIIFCFTQSVFAEITFEQVLKDPTNLELNLQYAKEQEKLKKFKNTLSALERLNILYPENIDIKLYLLSILVKLDSQEKANELIEQLKADQNLSAELSSYLAKLINQKAAQELKANQQTSAKKYYVFLDVYYNHNENSNVAGVSTSNTFYLSDSVSNFASTEIQYDKIYSKGVNLIIGENDPNNLSGNLNIGFSYSEQNKGDSETYDLSSISYSLSKPVSKHYLSSSISYATQNYLTQKDFYNFRFAVNDQYLINDKSFLNFGTSYSNLNYNTTGTFTTAYESNLDTYDLSVGYTNNFYKTHTFNIRGSAKIADAPKAYNSYQSQSLGLNYSLGTKIGTMTAGANLENNEYEAANSFYNSTLNRDDLVFRKSIGWNLSGAQFNNQVPLLNNSQVYVNYSETDTDSNMLNYNTKKNLLSIGFRQRFNLY